MDSELHKSIISGDIASMKALLQSGASVNRLHGLKGTPLCAAIATNQSHVVDFLLGLNNCDVNGADYDGEPPLCLAISKGFNDIANAIIHTAGCNLNVVDPVTHKTPLCLAICDGNTQIVESLINAGCNVDKEIERGNTALHYAITDSNKDIVKLLLAGKASLSKYNMNGHNILHHSIYRENIECTKLLLMHLEEQTEDIRKAVIDALTQIHSDSCLHLAVEVGSLDLLDLLLNYQSNINITNTAGHSPLYKAVKKNSTEFAGRLLSAGANPNVTCHDVVRKHYQIEKRPSSMLHAAVNTGNLDLVRMLLEKGASVNVVEFRGNNALMVALNRNKPEIARYLMEHSDIDVLSKNEMNESCLFAALSCSDPAWFIKELVRRGCAVNERNSDLQTPLDTVVHLECTEVMEILLDNGCDPNAMGEGVDKSLLHISAMNDCLDATRMLLFYGADIDALDGPGQSPLELALTLENYEIAVLLLESGANARPLMSQYNSIEAIVEDLVQEQEWVDTITKLLHDNYPVPKLSEFCRKSIREYLLQNHISPKVIRSLPIPDRISRFLSFRTYLVQ